VNWNKNYINDITTVAANQNCPSGYELWHNIEWPGIYKGCDCIGKEDCVDFGFADCSRK